MFLLFLFEEVPQDNTIQQINSGVNLALAMPWSPFKHNHVLLKHFVSTIFTSNSSQHVLGESSGNINTSGSGNLCVNTRSCQEGCGSAF